MYYMTFHNDGQQLKVYPNDQGKVYIETGPTDEDQYYTGFVALDRADTEKLIEELRRILDEIEIT